MALLFPFKPNWASSYRVTHSHKTEIITSRAKREQRIAERQLPRKTIEFDAALSRGDMAALQGLVAKNQQGVFWVPDWTRWAELTAPLAIAGDTAVFASAPGWARVGQQLLLAHGDQTRLVEITAIGPTSVTFTPAVSAAFPAGTKAHCVYTATMDQNLRGRLLTNTVGEMGMSFKVKPGTISEPDDPAPLAFNGRELFITKPNWAAPPSVELAGFLEQVDYGRGVTSEFAPVAFNTRRLQMSFLFGTNDKAEAFLSFYRRMRGQQGEFYMPTWEPDLDPVNGAAPGATSLLVPGSDFHARYAGSTVYRAVVVFYRGGGYQVNRVTGITLEGINSRVNVLSPWTSALSPATVRQICFLPVWRFATDDVTVEWQTNHAAQVQTTFQTLEDL